MSAAADRTPSRRFETVELEIVWAGVERLDVGDQHVLFAELSHGLFVEPHLADYGPRSREARAVLALREAADIEGHSPSIARYTDLRELHPEYGWPDASRVRAWLGRNSWNRALERAGLVALAIDVVIREKMGSSFSRDDLIKSVALAADDLGVVPTFTQYSLWARRPDVVARRGRLPKSLKPYVRMFGSWSDACIAAGLRGEHTLVDSRGRIRYARHEYRSAECLDALRLVADALGHPPRAAEYVAFRRHAHAPTAGTRGGQLPSADSIRRHFDGDWAAACVAAGLGEPAKPFNRAYGDEELVQVLARAIADGVRTPSDYERWRSEKLREGSEGDSPRIPSDVVVRKALGGWRRARALAQELLEKRRG